ncbi:phospholipase ABHD3-like isoform X2 [Adelges cooleyi]|uniref:phospholipase ABHD3-like isoform X2 n=1 Tax=Adelges cooleyi TaxID=133065 RepID=UPI00217F748A|nr:phospholipase ABHD3-like isoform X2 [Adelges cooleyi]
MDFFVNQILNLSGFTLLSVFGSTAIIGFTYYYLTSVVEEPKLHCKEGNFKSFLYQHVTLTKTKIWPLVLGFEPRMNTMFAFFIRHLFVPSVKYDRELLNLTDGGQVALDFLEPNENSKNGDVTILVLPGFGHSSRTGYARAASLALQKSGFRVVVFNYRGIGGVKLKTPKSYSGSNIEDLIEVIIRVKLKYPKTVLGGLGISMGGTLLGNYMCSNYQHTQNHLSAAMLVSVAWNAKSTVSSSSKNIMNRMIDWFFTRCIIKYIKKNSKVLNGPNQKWNYNEVIKSKNGDELMRNYIIKMFDHDTVEAFYDSVSLHDKIDHFNIPCLCLSAADDPLSLKPDVPVELASTTENVAILLTTKGGHIGFFDNFSLFSENNEFMIRLIMQYFEAIFKNDNYKKFTN